MRKQADMLSTFDGHQLCPRDISGHGLSVGSYTSSGLTNYLVENVNLAGTAQDSNATGLRLKSAAD